jgi:uncharacterized protein (DUF1800 family)
MPARTTIASLRYGYGFAPGQHAATGAEDLLADLATPRGPAPKAADWTARRRLHAALAEANKAYRAGAPDAAAHRKQAIGALDTQLASDYRLHLGRSVSSAFGFRERLVAFWTDHFTVRAQNRVTSLILPDMIETAIRPHVGGRFADMLRASVLHPAMLRYLDQTRSIGPLSRAGRRTGRGLNENLAREVLELHTLGAQGHYTQTDVRQFAELLTGLAVGPDGFVFRPALVEPGAETVLGRTYGGLGQEAQGAILNALDDLAAHPDTAAHLSRKLVVHFLGPSTPADQHDALVSRMAQAYLRADTDLSAVYAVLLEDPLAWALPLAKVRPPGEFIVAALRAAGIGAAQIAGMPTGLLRRGLMRPLASMGQPLWRPVGPDGWPEEPAAWITPAALAARLRWALAFAERALADTDPRAFVQTALRDASSSELRFAVAGAERRVEGVALVLSSPEFNRR